MMRKAGSVAGLLGVLAVATVWLILSGAGAGSATGVAALDATGSPITQSLDCPDDDFEDDNDTTQTATFSTIPFHREGLRACPNDLDFYIFPLSSGDEIQIDAFFDHEEGNIQMSIFDQSGTFLTGATSTTDNEKVEFTAGVAGNYQVVVFLQPPGLGTAPGNTYTLQVGFPDGLCPNDDFENNDTEDTPTLTGVPIYLDGLRSCPGDDDYFSFSFLSGPAEINTFFTHDEGNLNLRLIDPNGMITTAFTTEDNERIDLATTIPGMYRIGISNVDDLGSAAGNTYALQISQPGGLCPDDGIEEDDGSAGPRLPAARSPRRRSTSISRRSCLYKR